MTNPTKPAWSCSRPASAPPTKPRHSRPRYQSILLHLAAASQVTCNSAGYCLDACRFGRGRINFLVVSSPCALRFWHHQPRAVVQHLNI